MALPLVSGDTIGVKKQKSIRNTKHFTQLPQLPLRGRNFLFFFIFSTPQKISPATILKFRELFQNSCHTFSSTPAHFTVLKSHKLFQNKCHTFTASLSIEAFHLSVLSHTAKFHKERLHSNIRKPITHHMLREFEKQIALSSENCRGRIQQLQQ